MSSSNENVLNKRIWRLLMVLMVFGLLSMAVLIWKLRADAFATDQSSRIYIQKALHFHDGRYLSSSLAASARLGNRLFELVSLVGISRALNRTLIFWVEDSDYSDMLNVTKDFIPGIYKEIRVVLVRPPYDVDTVKFPNSGHSYESPERLKDYNSTLLHLSGIFYQSWKFFPTMRDEVLRDLNKKTTGSFNGLPESNATSVITCVHVRRGDFMNIGWHVADENFIRKSLDFIHTKEHLKPNQSRSIVLLGDDQKFMRNLLPSTTSHFVSENSPSNDLLYSSNHCDILFYTAPVSTFGWWMGYLSKGNKVYYTDPRYVEDVLFKTGWIVPQDLYLPNWTPLKLDRNSSNSSNVISTSYEY